MSEHDQTAIVPAGSAPDRLDRWLPALTELSRTRARKAIDAGGVYVDGKRCRTQSRLVGPGCRLRVIWSDAPPASVGPEPVLVFRDPHLVIVDKPAGVPCQATRVSVHGTVERWVAGQPRVDYVALHHRLDRPAQGLLAVGVSRDANRGLARAFAERLAVRRYRALLAGALEGEGVWEHRFVEEGSDRRAEPWEGEGVPMRSSWRAVERIGPHTLVEVRLETGRTHQIRLQAAAAGAPIVGDRRYGRAEPGGLRLQAFALDLPHPVTDEPLSFVLDPPGDWGLDALRSGAAASAP